jgi:hypothetical protein
MEVHTGRSQSAAAFVQGQAALSMELLTMTSAGVVFAVCGFDESPTLNDLYQCSSPAAK